MDQTIEIKEEEKEEEEDKKKKRKKKRKTAYLLRKKKRSLHRLGSQYVAFLINCYGKVHG